MLAASFNQSDSAAACMLLYDLYKANQDSIDPIRISTGLDQGQCLRLREVGTP